MEANKIHNFVTLYDIEAQSFDVGFAEEEPSFWLLLLKATGIFFVITIIVFCIANYQYIRSQLFDWRQSAKTKINFQDFDGDGIPGWWEDKYGFDDSRKEDMLLDGDNDHASNLLEYQFGTDPSNADSDSDGYSDGEEIAKGYNPNGEGRIDSDKDGVPDWWESRYGLDKNDVLDADDDFDEDGLLNKDEYKYLTNPQEKDSDHDGYFDGEEILLGQNPIGEGPLTDKKLELGEDDFDGDGLTYSLENFFGTDTSKKDTDGDGFDDARELTRGYDPTGEGMIKAIIQIPKISVVAPVVWSQKEDEKKIQEDLEKGTIHYPGTAFPGLRGNNYVTGHSSYYTWSKSLYKTVFQDLNKLEKGDDIIFDLEFSSGKKVEVVYRVVSNEVVLPDDPRLFRDFEGAELTLVTCWPIGTDWKRVMVKANLVK